MVKFAKAPSSLSVSVSVHTQRQNKGERADTLRRKYTRSKPAQLHSRQVWRIGMTLGEDCGLRA